MFGGGSVFGNQPNTGGGLFGQNQPQNQNMMGGQGSLFGQQPQQNTGGIFGGNQTQQNQGGIVGGGGVFGGGNQNNQGGGIFGGGGSTGNAFGGNTTPQTGGGLFGNTAGGSVFGNQNQNPQGSVFGGGNTSAFGNPNTNVGGNVFGGNTGGGGIFGGFNKPQGNVFGTQNTGGVFGNTNTGGAFGSTNTGGGIFGNNANTGFGQNQNMGGGVFGNANTFGTVNTLGGNTPTFGGSPAFSSTNTGGGIFGNANTNIGGGVFGNAQNTNTSAFGGAQNTGGIFGGSQNQNQGGIFGGATNTSFGANTNTGGGIFGGGNTQQNTGGIFGGGNQSTSIFGNKPNTGSAFGTNTTQSTFNFGNNSFGNNQANKFGTPQNNLGNTAWGVPTSNQSMAKFTPLKPKNNKIDGKHVVKCIVLLDENTNFCKNQLRIKYIMSGGNTTQPPGAFGGSTFGVGTTNTTGFGASNTFQSPQTGNSLFGGATSNTGGGLFGGQTLSQPSTGIFGQSGNTGTSGGLFGNTSNQTAGGGLFGGANNSFKPIGGFGTTPAGFGTGTTSAFGSSAPSTGGLFGGNTNTGGGLFGASTMPMNTGGNSIFGGNASAFGATTNQSNFSFGANQQQAGGLFGQAPTNNSFLGNQTAPSGGLFGAQNQAPGTSFSGCFGQPMTVPQQPMLGAFPITPNPNTQLATLLLNGLFNTDFFKKMMGGNATTPFQELVNQAKNNKNVSFENRSEQAARDLLNNDDYFGPSRTSKFNKDLYNSSINFHHSPYLYTDQTEYQTRVDRQGEELRDKFRNFTEKFEPKPAPIRKYKANDSILYKDFSSEFSQRPAAAHSSMRKRKVSQDQLPIIDSGYKIIPSLAQLKQKTPQQLRKVPNVIIQNQFGKIKFKQPINLQRKRISQCVEIVQDSIQIMDSEWDEKKCELYFKDFGHYTELKNAEEKSKLERKMKKWIEKNNMEQLNFNRDNGELHVEIF